MGKTKSKIKYAVASFLLVAAVIIANAVFGGAFAEEVSIEQNGSRLIAKNGSEVAFYQWKWLDGETYIDIENANEKYYDLTEADSGRTIKVFVDGTESTEAITVGKVVVFDLSLGSVIFGNKYSGNGGMVTGTHEASNIYIVTQSNVENYSTNKISFTGKVDGAFDVTLSGIHLGDAYVTGKTPDASGIGSYAKGVIDLQPGNEALSKKVILRLKGENIVKAIHYYTNGNASKSSLKITDINGDGASDGGSLYVPIKVEESAIDEFVNSNLAYNHWNSGIGGDDSSGDQVTNLEIAGGKLQVLTTYADNCTAIGAGGNGACTMTISGGKVIAHNSGTGAAIGGGIGWHSAGGTSKVTITGGEIYAENHGKIFVKATYNSDGSISTTKIVKETEEHNEIIGGVAIGSGSSVKSGGSTGTVTITGGNIKAYAAYGNGIGGGNSSSGKGGDATITISGGKVEASSIGGGNSKNKTGGGATVTIKEEANVTLIKGIGGGSSDSGNGGDATITVENGTISCGGVIGGGNGGGTGNGGTATINVKGGILTSQSVGGGTGSVGGNGGAAKIIISGGKIETGSIGGGTTTNPNGSLGYATADISGGDISGQFLLYAAGEQKCYFNMTGGTLHNVNTADNTKYSYANENGAAVYMDDPKGEVTISGGAIENCSAKNGGAVYMTAGTFKLSGTGSISGNTATENGGAIYLKGGTVTISGGSISENNATENGGGVYLGGGEFTVNGGEVSSNNAFQGGGAFVNGGKVLVFSGKVENNTASGNGGGFAVNNGNFGMTGGSVSNNKSNGGSGGGIYVSATDADVTVDVLSGSVSKNSAAKNGGALAVVGDETSDKKITVTIGVNKVHINTETGEKLPDCEHGDKYGQTDCFDCPETKNNTAGEKGGAFFVTGNNQNTTLNIHCLIEEGSKADGEKYQSNFMKVEGGRVLISTSENENEASQNDYNGNISIQNSIYVTGGDVDIWGKMINPDIKDVITVDIIDADTDEFHDHRENDAAADSEEKFYKIIYFENFKDPVTGKVTGQYKEDTVVHNGNILISGSIYSHPGYEIVGWNTDPGVTDTDMTDLASNEDEEGFTEENRNGWYQVNGEYQFNGFCRGDLTIYAIWEANGYTVEFNPNVPSGQEFSGTMANQIHTYNVEQVLTKNAFERPGYEFDGWNTKADGTGTSYSDEQKVMNLTTKENELVVLYAQWKECDHNPESHVYTYTLVEEGKGIKCECSCKGYSETIILSASDTVYDKNEHPAALNHSSTNPGIEKKIALQEISYSKKNQVTEEFSPVTEVPKNAGTYMASITIEDITANVIYTIEKADQPAPPKPEFTIGDDTKSLSVKQVKESDLKETDPTGYDSVREYMLVYYDSNNIEQKTEWIKADDSIAVGGIAHTFNLDYALTNYSVYVRYSEGENYKASPEVKADGKYFYSGNVSLTVIGGIGIDYRQSMASGEGNSVTENGIQIDVWLLEGYYFPKDYNECITIKTESNGGENLTSTPIINRTIPYKEYKIDQIPENCNITVTLPDAIKAPSIVSNITEKQVFDDFTDNEAVISRDSAFTAGFEIKDFNPDDYSELVLSFEIPLPKGTKIIVQDRNSDNFGYYSHKVTDEGGKGTFGFTSDFGRMGTENEKFALYQGNMLLNIVVDFSEAETKFDKETIIIPVITAVVKSEETQNEEESEENPEDDIESEPEIAAEEGEEPQVGPAEVKSGNDISATLKKEAVFTLEVKETEAGISKIVEYKYTPSEGAASIWDNRDTAIVIKKNEEETKELPADARIVFSKETYRIEAYPNGNGEFILPVTGPEDGTVEIYLVSKFLNGEEYIFDVSWKTSESIAETSPTNGDLNFEIKYVVLKGRTATAPSIKVYEKNDTRLFKAGESIPFNAVVEWKDFIATNELEIMVMQKIDREDGTTEYVSTAWNKKIDTANSLKEGEIEIEIPLAVYASGSYCIRIRLLEGLIFVSESNYYFIIA